MKTVLLALALILTTSPVWATTRYMATVAGGGSDSNSCGDSESTSLPKATFTSAVACMSAGDTLYVRSGTYSQTITSSLTIPSGTSYDDAPLIAAFPGETVTLTGTDVIGLTLTANHHIIIQGFTLTGGSQLVSLGGSTTAKAAHHIKLVDMTIHGGTHQCVQIGKYAHDMWFTGGSVYNCGLSENVSQAGYPFYIGGNDHIIEHMEVYNSQSYCFHIFENNTPKPNRVTVRYNKIHGCSTARASSSAILFAGGDGHAAYRNIIYSTSGHGVLVQSSATNVKVYHNSIHGALTGVKVLTATNTLVTNNILFGNNAATENSGTGTVFTTNLTSDPSYVNSASADFSLLSGSAAINTGTAISGFNCNGTCDIGAHETSGFSSATVNENSLDVTLGMSLNTPVQVTTTGWSVRVGGVARTVTSAAKLTGSDTVVRITFSGAVCAGGETWDVSYAQTGATTDSASIGDTDNQELLAFTNQSATNNCGSAPPADPGTPYISYLLDETSGTTLQDETANNLDGTATNGPTVGATGKHSFGVSFTKASTQYIAVPYGSGVNPTSQSLTICMGVLPTAGEESGSFVFWGPSNGTNQRLYLSWQTGTWSQGVQANSHGNNVDFPVAAGWTYVCQVVNAGTDQVTLYVNGVAGTSSQSVKSMTSFTLASDFRLGQEGTTSAAPVTLDDVKVYQSALSAADILDLYQAWEQTSPTPTGTYTQVAHQWQLLRSPETDYGAASATMPVIVGGAVSLVTQVDCTAADCDPTGLKLYYSCALCDTAGAWLPVPDSAGSDGVSFYGASTDPDLVTGTVECCLSGALTANDGSTQLTAAAVPSIDMAQNASFTRRSVIKFTSSVTAGRTYCFQEYHQTGVALATPTPSTGACVTIASPSMGVGF